MKRFTECEQINEGDRIISCNVSHQLAMERLADYEDTGLSPEGVKELLHDSVGPLHKKLGEWIDADKESRLLVLPCKIGDILFWADIGIVKKKIVECCVSDIWIDGYGVYVVLDRLSPPEFQWRTAYTELIGSELFLTREEAEKALEGRK